MGGMFQQQQTPTQVTSQFPPAFEPFVGELMKAISTLFQEGMPGVTPLEESTIRGSFQQAEPARDLLDRMVRGEYLPGTNAARGNPFLGSLMQGLEGEGDVARRQLASAAQRSGALSGTDYMNQAAGLESGLFQKRGQLLSGLYESERGRQMGAIPQAQDLSQFLLGMAGHPRSVAERATLTPFDIGLRAMGGTQGQVIPGQSQPSPFASLLRGLAPFAQFIKF